MQKEIVMMMEDDTYDAIVSIFREEGRADLLQKVYDMVNAADSINIDALPALVRFMYDVFVLKIE